MVAPLCEESIQDKRHSELLARLDDLLTGQQMLLHEAFKSGDVLNRRQSSQSNEVAHDGRFARRAGGNGAKREGVEAQR